jgi:NTE family protein
MEKMDHHVGKTALVLAGGGLTGAVYHIGALRAINDLLVDRTVNDFDIFVGTSAGALIGSLLANGFTTEEMLKVMDGSHPEIHPITRRNIFSLNYRDYVNWGLRVPQKLINISYGYLRNRGELTLFDLLWSLSEAIPPGLYDGLALERYVRYLFEGAEKSNKFDDLERELYIIATDLDTGDRVVFGKGERMDITISLAVAASSALPILYKPVRIADKEFVDGGLRGTASLDLAIERGATLVVCINPLVPFDNRNPQLGASGRPGKRLLSDRGIRSVADQVIRTIGHSGLQYHIKQLRRRHPEVDIILIEPRQDDYQMFFNNIMRYSARLTVARHGFESVTLDLAEDYPRYKNTLARHGIPISRRLVIEELNEIYQSGYNPEVIRRILEARTSSGAGRGKDSPAHKLTRTLAELELMLDDISD